MLDRKEAKEIAQFVLKELRKSSYAYSTDGRFDYRKTGVGRAKGGTIGQIGPEYQHYVCDVVWTSTGEDTIEWSAGSVKLADGRSQSLNSGGVTLEGTGLNYFWAVIGNPEIQTSTNYYDGVGDDKALLAFATKAPENDQLALVFPFFGTEPTFNSDVLSANMVLAAHIKAGVITASHIQVGSITADRLDFTPFIVGSGTLDQVLEGTTFGRVRQTHLSDGAIYISGITVFSDGYNPTHKSKTFYTEPSTPYNVGDIWIDDKIYKYCITARQTGAYQAGDWTDSVKKRIASTYISDGQLYLSSVIEDGTHRVTTDTEKTTWNAKTKTFRQTTAPATGMQAGDIWIDTNDGDKPYTYNGASWVASYTIIDGGNITTGTIDCSQVTIQDYGASPGVEISSTGINIWGKSNALTTRATKTGTVQCSVNSSGEISAGAGAIRLNSDGLNIYGYTQALYLRSSGGTIYGYIWLYSAGVVQLYSTSTVWINATLEVNTVRSNSGSLTLYPQSSSDVIVRTSSDNSLRAYIAGYTNLGHPSYRWRNVYGNPVLATTYYALYEGELAMAGGGSGDLYVYSDGAWRANT